MPAPDPAFYVLLKWHESSYAWALRVVPVLTGDPREYGICTACGEPLGQRPWLPPQRMAVSKGVLPDFLFGPGFDIMMSDRAIEVYQSTGLTGITQIDPPAQIIRVGRRKPADWPARWPNYHNIRYLRGGASIDDAASHARRPRLECAYCRRGIEAIDGVVIEPGSWTGADIFEAHGLAGIILVTQRFRDAVEAANLTGAEFVEAEKYSFDQGSYPEDDEEE